jgi:hypothetical protein
VKGKDGGGVGLRRFGPLDPLPPRVATKGGWTECAGGQGTSPLVKGRPHVRLCSMGGGCVTNGQEESRPIASGESKLSTL